MRFWVVVVGMLGGLALCAGSAAATVTREGVLREEVADDFANGTSTTTYALGSNGSRVPVVPTQLVAAEAGDRVSVTGAFRAGALVGEVTDETASTAASDPPTGVRKVAVLLIRFPDSAPEPWSPQVVRERVFTAFNSADAFYREETYGRISLTGKNDPSGDVFGWFTLNPPTTECSYTTWRVEAKAAAEAAGISLAGYDHIIYVNAPRQQCTAAGIGEIGGTQVNIFGNQSTKTYAHELGHNLGLHHASSETCTLAGVRVQISGSCTISEYGDIFDVMGKPNTRHNNSIGLEQLGVLAPENIRIVDANGIYEIQAAFQSSLEPTTLRIARTRDGGGNVTSWYYLEIRETGGVFENVSDASTNGVSIRIAPVPASSARTILLDANPGSATFADAPLQPGNAFVDGSTRVETLQAEAGAARVAVSLVPDGTPPSAPGGLAAAQDPSGSVTLSWSASPDIDVIHYVVVRDGLEIGTSAGTGYADNAAPVGLHAYVVYAQDLAGNRSEASAPKTLLVADLKAPSAPSGLSAKRVGDDVALSWAPSTDNVGVTRYAVFRDGTEIGTVSTTRLTDLAPVVGSHVYVVYAEDAAGNRSEASQAVSFMVSERSGPAGEAPQPALQSTPPGAPALRWRRRTDGRLRFEVDATGEARVVRVGLWIDGRRLGVRSGRVLVVAWDPACARVHFVVARAYDSAGSVAVRKARLRLAGSGQQTTACRPWAGILRLGL